MSASLIQARSNWILKWEIWTLRRSGSDAGAWELVILLLSPFLQLGNGDEHNHHLIKALIPFIS